MTMIFKQGLLASCVIAAIGWAGTASAQTGNTAETGPSTTASGGPGIDIVVVARRREERLQEVPLSVAAVSQSTLQQQNITSVVDLGRAVPSLISVPALGSGRSVPVFAIRGLSQEQNLGIFDPSITVYQGDIVAARSYGLNSTLFDIGSVEVLRGPQGTLFGRNSTGGAVVIRPNRPTEFLEGSLAVTFGRFDKINTEAMLNLPVNDYIQIRLAGATKKDDGYVTDDLLGRKVDDTDQQAARAGVLMASPGGAESYTVYNYFHEDDGGTPTFIYAVNPNGAFASAAFRGPRNQRPLQDLLAEQQSRKRYHISTGTPIFTKVETHDIANTTTVPITDDVSIKNIFGYRHIDMRAREDYDGTSNSFAPQQVHNEYGQFSNELQLLGTSRRFTWILGGYYFRERGNYQGESAYGAVDPGDIEPQSVTDYPSLPNGVNAYNIVELRNVNTSYAFYAQGDYNLTNELTLTAGVRYNHDKREIDVSRQTFTTCGLTRDLDNNPATPETVVPLGPLCNVQDSTSFSEPTYNISLNYQLTPEKLLYIAHRHGYRTGGFGARSTSEAASRTVAQPETVDDIEVGFKGDWYLGQSFLRTNLATYYAKYKDLQRQLTDQSFVPPGTVTLNVGRARIWGVEADILFRPIPMIDLTVNYAYTNAKYREFIFPDGSDHTDDPFARAPKNVYSIGARINPPIPSGMGEVSAGVSLYHTDSFNGSDLFTSKAFDQVEGRTLLNVDAGWRGIMGTNFDLHVFVTNLTNKYYSNLAIDLSTLGVVSHTYGEPRTWGITAKYRFGR